MSIISKETWDNMPQEEKERILTDYQCYKCNNDYAKGVIETYVTLFGKEQLHIEPLTYDDVDKKLKEIEGGKEWVCTYFADKVNAIIMLLEVAKFLNKDWKPDSNYIQDKWYIAEEKGELKIDYHDDGHNSHIVYFRTQWLAQQAIQILGKDVILIALTTDY